ncbi:MAG: hypothetical protein ACFFCS_28955 [Candidatus Hodarchaeota archaeon]
MDKKQDNADHLILEENQSKDKAIEADVDRFDTDKQFPEFKGWEAVGFHRPLGKELWQVVFEQLNNMLYIFVFLYLVPIIRPFPEIDGINHLAGSLFGIFYVIFDTGTNFGISRFIAEYRIKSPKRMLMYVSFFIKYQMLTGIIQVTLLSWYTFEIIINSNYAYLAWMLLIILQKQWPGMLPIFKTVLSGLQHHAKVEIMNILQTEVVERITLIGFVIVGRVWGESNPAIGIMMGICIFTHLGNYIDDIIFGFISMHYTNKILKKYLKTSLREVFRIKISMDVYKQMIFYGVQGSLLPILSTFVNTMTLLAYSSQIPGYISWSALIYYGQMFSGIIGNFGDFALGTSIAESYSNGKKTLAEFYVSYSIRWRYFFYILVAVILFAIIPFFVEIIEMSNSPLAYYKGTTMFFVPFLIRRLFDPILGLPDPIMVGTERITQYNIIRAIEEVLKFFFLYFFVYWLKVQETWGMFGLLFLIGFSHIIPYIIKTIMCYVYVQKKILKIKIYWKSTLVGPFIAAIPLIAFTSFWYYTGFPWLKNAIGIEFTIVLSLILLLFTLLLVYFPLNVLLPGWDDYMFFVFKKAVKLSGPSKPFFALILNIMIKFRNASIKLGTWNRKSWVIPHEEAHKEIIELMEIKKEFMKKGE